MTTMVTTTLQIASDIHLEKRTIPFDEILTPSAKVLALVGDIGSPFSSSLKDFFEWCSDKYEHVLYVPGNHEYYNTQGIDIEKIDAILESICSIFPNVHFMQNKTMNINDCTFICSILWSHVPNEHIYSISTMMNDYRYIYKTKDRLLTVQDTNDFYEQNKSFIEKQVQIALENGKKPIILTHHTPSMHKTSAPCYEGGVSCYAFSSTLACPPGIIRFWACGHTHYNFHHSHEGYELMSNQFGYGNIGTRDYKKDVCIEL